MVVRMHVNGGSVRVFHLHTCNGLRRSCGGGCLVAYFLSPWLRLANAPMGLAAGTFAGLALAQGTNTLVRGRATGRQHQAGRGQEGEKGGILPDGIRRVWARTACHQGTGHTLSGQATLRAVSTRENRPRT